VELGARIVLRVGGSSWNVQHLYSSVQVEFIRGGAVLSCHSPPLSPPPNVLSTMSITY
jgi:hypothetical protein